MSPEQCSSGRITGASDQYSLGAMAYQMLTGQPPFLGATLSVLQAHVGSVAAPIADMRPDCPEDLRAAIERMLAQKFGTPLPKTPLTAPRQPEPPPVVLAKPVAPPPPPPVADRPSLSEKPVTAGKPPVPEAPRVAEQPAAKPATLATAPPRLTAPLTTPRSAETVSPPPSAPKKPQVAERAVPVEPRPARLEESPVVVARPRSVEAERVPVAVKTVAAVERHVAVPPAVAATHAELAPVQAERVAAVRAPVLAPPRASGPSHDAVRGLLDRYAAAWRGHDVDTLRAIGQVTNDGQANALRQYFANVGSLQVEVRVLDIRSEGNRATVRFTRRDRFRDPTGREIEKESPPIEKVVVVTPQGLRFAPAS